MADTTVASQRVTAILPYHIATYIINVLNLDILTHDHCGMPPYKAIMSRNSSHCYKSKCSSHDVQIHQRGLLEGCSNQSEP